MVSYNRMDGERVANKVLIKIKIIMLSIKFSLKENNIYLKQLNTQTHPYIEIVPVNDYSRIQCKLS